MTDTRNIAHTSTIGMIVSAKFFMIAGLSSAGVVVTTITLLLWESSSLSSFVVLVDVFGGVVSDVTPSVGCTEAVEEETLAVLGTVTFTFGRGGRLWLGFWNFGNGKDDRDGYDPGKNEPNGERKFPLVILPGRGGGALKCGPMLEGIFGGLRESWSPVVLRMSTQTSLLCVSWPSYTVT